MHPGGAGLLIRPGLSICVPPGGFHNVLYAPPGGAGLKSKTWSAQLSYFNFLTY